MSTEVTKVLFLARPLAVSGPGGYHTHVIETKSALERLGIQVDLILRADLDFTKYDIVHVFAGHGIWLNASYFAMKAAKRAHLPVAISPIFVVGGDKPSSLASQTNLWRTDQPAMGPLKRALKYALPAWTNAVYSWMRLSKFPIPFSDFYHWHKLDRKMPRSRSRDNIVGEMFLEADVLLPNSHVEMDSIKRFLRVENKYHVVRNGTDLSFADANPEWFVDKFGIRDFVMCAAYLCERKNQLALIRATKVINVPLVLVGNAQGKYADTCRKEAGEDVIFTGPLSRQEIASAYAAAKVHVLPSFYETTGIVSLEAALAGCTVVVGNRSAEPEYFNDFVHYCDPASEESIRSAVLKALKGPPRPGLKEHIMQNFNWDKAAQETLEGYRIALTQK